MQGINKRFNKIYLKIMFFLAIVFTGQNTMCMDMVQDQIGYEIVQETNLGLSEKYLAPLTIKEIMPENTVFAFDIHEVLVGRYKSMIMRGGFKLFCKTILYLIMHPFFVRRLAQIAREYNVFEGMYTQIAEEYPYWKRYKQDFLEISNNCCYHIEPMVELLEQLKQKGYKIFMLSNMGTETWSDFEKKFESVAKLFDGFYTPNKENKYIGKPNGEFYQGFKQYLNNNGHEGKQILFVDDMEDNIVGAHAEGIAGIHFIGHKNLCNKLTELGITLKEKLS